MNQFNNTLIFNILFVGLLAITPIIAHSENFIEGTHYSRLNYTGSQTQKTPEPEVVEYFSFSCPGCYVIEPSIKALRKLEPTLKLSKVHMPYGGRKAKYSQKAFVLMTLLKANEYTDAIFNRVHQQRDTFDSDQEVIDFFEGLGFQRSRLETMLNSFSADAMIRKMNRDAINKKIRSVPTLIVNSTYQVNVGVVNDGASLAALVKHLHRLP